MIRKLPECVISRIAAGEVVTAPSNILKELIENSIDAGAANIVVGLSSSVLSLSVEDDGSGVSKDDLELMCQNHYTSKIATLEDLKHCGTISALSTFGFRGEALHAIAVSSHLTITARTAADAFAHQGTYSGPDLVGTAKVARESVGTSVAVSDIFYRNQIRKDHFYKNKVEYTSCKDLVKSYGCIHSGVSLYVDSKLVLGKDELPRQVVMLHSGAPKSSSDSTAIGGAGASVDPIISNRIAASDGPSKEQHGSASIISTPEGVMRVQNLAAVLNKMKYIGKAFLYAEKDVENLEHVLEPNYVLIVSNRNFFLKNYKFILFINNRLVRNNSLKRRILQKYKGLLKSGTYPFVYIEIQVGFVDVNVHPSKAEVLLAEDDVFEDILRKVEAALSSNRHFVHSTCSQTDASEKLGESFLASYMGMYDGADGSGQAADSLLTQYGLAPESDAPRGSQGRSRGAVQSVLSPSPEDASMYVISASAPSSTPVKSYACADLQTVEEATKKKRASLRVFALESMRRLKEEIREVDTAFVRSLVYVGCTKELIFAQSHLNLISIEREPFIRECVYLHLIYDFGNFEARPVAPSAAAVDESLCEMLADYFKIRVEDGMVTEAPAIFDLCAEQWGGFRIARKTEYETFRDVINSVADIYRAEPIGAKAFNMIKRSVCGTQKLVDCCKIVVALKDLYKKFGRC
ncbi:DNA mismatch repair protein MLH1 [Pancytospora philotis]|nr:DNA mismatch repair protein MLH1 [Pancytospora philotis]